MPPSRIAVIGTGIAGMASAWLLARHHQVTVYEADSRLGGHSNTVMVDDPTGPTAVDTGFIVFNRTNYPHLSALFETLGVATQTGDMSFAVSADRGRMEYSGTSLNGLFGQRGNLLRPGFHRMLLDIVRFNRAARGLARSPATAAGSAAESLGSFLERLGVGVAMRERYLLPMAAAIWSCPPRTMLEFPAVSLARFFDNHGLLNVNDRPQWRTVTGGSMRYVNAITRGYADSARRGSAVTRVEPVTGGVQVTDATGHSDRFQQVVVATHADQAARLLPVGDRRRNRLACFGYQSNRAVLHRDASLMPVRRRIWSAWNYLAETGGDDAAVSVTYWMNCLQRLDCAHQYFVSLNPLREPDPRLRVAEFDYEHPVFDRAAMAAQRTLPASNGVDGIWLAGSYLGYGFHEDALRSAVDVARGLGAPAPWALPGADAPSRAYEPLDSPGPALPAPQPAGQRG